MNRRLPPQLVMPRPPRLPTEDISALCLGAACAFLFVALMCRVFMWANI